jgi:hypothetical protein
MAIDAAEDVGEPGLRIDAVQFGGLNEREHGGGALAAAVGAAEGPIPAPREFAVACRRQPLASPRTYLYRPVLGA